jgi:hypothetical protein
MITENYKTRLQELAGVKKRVRAYHGTPHKFDKFKLDKSGSQNNAGDFGKGIYFSTDKKVAEAYANDSNGFILTVELNIANPYKIDFENYSKYKLKQEKGEIDRNLINPEIQKYIDILKKGGAEFGISDVKNEDTRVINFFSISDKFGAIEISKCLKKEGYDSIVVKYGTGDEIVVFDENQVEIIKRDNVS